MYGLVNKALQEMIVDRYGNAKWEEIRKASGIEQQFFTTMECYPDEVTYKLVGSACSVLGMSSDEIMRSFGGYWFQVAKVGYKEMLDFAGDNFVDFIKNLDNMHARIGLIFTGFRPPSFKCTEVTDSSLRLHYYSERPGLSPLVEGLLAGVGKHFSLKVDAVLDKSRAGGADHDEFIVRFRRA